jgi:hypothetical protein
MKKYFNKCGRTEKHSTGMRTFSRMAFFILTALCMTLMFACSKEELPKEEEGKGILVIQNLSDYDIETIYFYDEEETFIGIDNKVLEPDYQVEYDNSFDAGSYIVEVTDERDKSFKSKLFKLIKDKYTVLKYDGSSLSVIATGADKEEE